ncbi:MAG TPA: N-acetyl-gamma-glutamyl-phosphate reductase [Longimicrobium sp.]|nr:N-acetyl-gamma-glutamyl-phosphate reductase [Longimicrobium sp.]
MNSHATSRVGVLGASGYAGREAVRLLAGHKNLSIALATSESEAGASLSRVARGAPDLPLVKLADADLASCDAVLCCLPHGEAARWSQAALEAGAKVVDLSNDLRVVGPDTPEWARGAVYGLPELHRERIAGTELVANPGCYPTAAILALAPLLRREMAVGPVIVNAASGVTGAGRSPKRELLFAEVDEDYRPYAIGNVHRHLAEMRDQAGGLAAGLAPELVFTPHLLPVKRGILETIYVTLREPLMGDPAELWKTDYAAEPFVEIVDGRPASLADAVGTNRVAISVTTVKDVAAPMLIVTAAIDNLVKGAAGQAIQNLNLMLGLPETEGLA